MRARGKKIDVDLYTLYFLFCAKLHSARLVVARRRSQVARVMLKGSLCER